MTFYEYQNESHTLWEEDLENNVSEQNIGSSDLECSSEREEDDDHFSVKRAKFMTNGVEDLIANPQRTLKTVDQSLFKDDAEIDQSSQLPIPDPPKRKRGRPPGKKKQMRDASTIAFGDQGFFALNSRPLSTDPSQNGTTSGMEPPIPVKRGRGRPRKYPLPNMAAPVVNIPMPKSLMPSDFKICNFVKEVIASSRTSETPLNDQKENVVGFFNDLTSDITSLIPPGDKSPYEVSSEPAVEVDMSSVPSSPGSSPVLGSPKQTLKENGVLTPDVVMKRLEGHYGVNLSSRKHFLYEVFNLLWS